MVFIALACWLFTLSQAQAEFNMLNTDRVSKSDLTYDCLNYDYIMDYCIRFDLHYVEKETRPLAEQVIFTRTFVVLAMMNFTADNLLNMSAPIDVAERYQFFLSNPQSDLLENNTFTRCSPGWFGPSCEYTFDYDAVLFDYLVKTLFEYKSKLGLNPLEYNDLTCYMHLKCNRGSGLMCLDWREICDGKIDCLGDAVDETNCFSLENNKCADNEYQCRNGMCINEHFLRDGVHRECLDGTDELISDLSCGYMLGFVCEERSTWSANYISCGDGEEFTLLLGTDNCINQRNIALLDSLHWDANENVSSPSCVTFVACSAVYTKLICQAVCASSRDCRRQIEKQCGLFFIFPRQPIWSGYVYFGWRSNNTDFGQNPKFYHPDYVCFEAKLCPYIASTIEIEGYHCTEYTDDQKHRLYSRTLACLWPHSTENKTHCRDPSMYQCKNSSKCLAQHRLIDGWQDCFENDDEEEIHANSCALNDSHRFPCTSETKCISSRARLDSLGKANDCLAGEDEVKEPRKLRFSDLCNGQVDIRDPLMTHFSPETDESNCEKLCLNQYTQCDGAWNCPNGADELGCRPSPCNQNEHRCISPDTYEYICLNTTYFGDGKIDCLGAADERAFCRSAVPTELGSRYRCRNMSTCIPWYKAEPWCTYENPARPKQLREDCFNYTDTTDGKVCSITDINLKAPVFSHLTSSTFPTENQESAIVTNSSMTKWQEHDDVEDIHPDKRRVWRCNRGITIYKMMQKKSERCLCPPAYYGDLCQYQNERVSLTLQFHSESASKAAVYAMLALLIDNYGHIHSSNQFTYIPSIHCDRKFDLYFLYETIPKDMTKNYTIRIDAYDKRHLSYRTTWLLDVDFLFLPVNRMSARLLIPTQPSSPTACSISCGAHATCVHAQNKFVELCYCHLGWKGTSCSERQKECSCSKDSICIGQIHNRSICVCSTTTYGPRCLLQSICVPDTCLNNGICVHEDRRGAPPTFVVCLCPNGFSGVACEIQDTSISISFYDVLIAQSLFAHLITVEGKVEGKVDKDPTRITMFKRIPWDEETAVFQTSLPFHLIFAQDAKKYYLVVLQKNYVSSAAISTTIRQSQYCPHVRELLDKKIADDHWLRRVKHYHTPCQTRKELVCFHDAEKYMCLCNNNRQANCFDFDFNITYDCKGWNKCLNRAQCFQDHPTCPSKTMCVCIECFYGSKCQFNTKGFGISLDAILGYQIRPRLPIQRQPISVKVSIAVTCVMALLGLLSGSLSTMTFCSKTVQEVACGFYLLASSVTSLLIMFIFTLKFFLLLFSHMTIITNHTFLSISCSSIEFLLRLFTSVADWFNACVAIERTETINKGANFDGKRRKFMAKWVIVLTFIVTAASFIHDPVYRRLIDDEEEGRTWCLLQYSTTALTYYNSAINIIHSFGPFFINLVSAFLIIVIAARNRYTAQKQKAYKEHLREQFTHHKHLLISPVILVVLALPRLVISFLSGCMKSARDPWLYLLGYFISYVPSLLTFVVFILPSALYKKEFRLSLQRQFTAIQRYFTRS